MAQQNGAVSIETAYATRLTYNLPRKGHSNERHPSRKGHKRAHIVAQRNAGKVSRQNTPRTVIAFHEQSGAVPADGKPQLDATDAREETYDRMPSARHYRIRVEQ